VERGRESRHGTVASAFVRREPVRYCCDVIEDAKNWRVRTADVLDTLKTALDACLAGPWQC